ncbi:hypothetical protein AZI86_07190 [Bdellovibrio bacteriovorus]|uniref:Uncharacterized protein n=1 Tax=Bdellovibrio bacteriovorus TaxID=959 RepID=A0A150WRH4_BDEBC|nr:hypothetical protein [Bdellovibrio bacteriovorus]KYG66815.1 hypothetical protein AZI86_07190 [Bdellovibrio bacteriovorus]
MGKSKWQKIPHIKMKDLSKNFENKENLLLDAHVWAEIRNRIVHADIRKPGVDDRQDLENLLGKSITAHEFQMIFGTFSEANPKRYAKWYNSLFSGMVDDVVSATEFFQGIQQEQAQLPKTLFLEKLALLCVEPAKIERTFGDIEEVFRSEIIKKHCRAYVDFWYSFQLLMVIVTSVGPFLMKALGIKEVIEKFVK